jgi:hypothetical protein
LIKKLSAATIAAPSMELLAFGAQWTGVFFFLLTVRKAHPRTFLVRKIASSDAATLIFSAKLARSVARRRNLNRRSKNVFISCDARVNSENNEEESP